MTEDVIAQVKNLYAIVCRGDINDGERGARLVSELEELVGKKFKNTQEFHYYIADFLKRKQVINESAGRKFRRLRKKGNMTQADASTKFKVDRRTIIRWENEEQTPSPAALQWIGTENGSTGENVTS